MLRPGLRIDDEPRLNRLRELFDRLDRPKMLAPLLRVRPGVRIRLLPPLREFGDEPGRVTVAPRGLRPGVDRRISRPPQMLLEREPVLRPGVSVRGAVRLVPIDDDGRRLMLLDELGRRVTVAPLP